MDDALGNPFVVEVKYILSEMKIVDKRRAARSDAQSILDIGNRTALGGRQNKMFVFRERMQLATFAAMKLLIVNGNGGRGVGGRGRGGFFGYWPVGS